MFIMTQQSAKAASRSSDGGREKRLAEIETGQWVRISSLPEGILYAQFVRLGIHEGQRVKCLERLPGGTIVLQKNRQQVAVGHALAKIIYVVADGERK